MKTTFYHKNGQILENHQFLFEDISILVKLELYMKICDLIPQF